MKPLFLLLALGIFLASCAPTYVPPSPPPTHATPEQQQTIFEDITKEQYPEGTARPPAILIEFLDYQCPFCQQVSSSVREIEATFGDKLGVITQHFPLDRQCNPFLTQQIHSLACGAAIAAECAREQDQFHAYQTKLFISKKLDKKSLLSHAKELSLNMQAFTICVDTKKTLPTLQTDMLRAARLGVEGTPTFYLNGNPLPARSTPELSFAIRSVLNSS